MLPNAQESSLDYGFYTKPPWPPKLVALDDDETTFHQNSSIIACEPKPNLEFNSTTQSSN
jgi:hypothetical protein